jgi:hypothetical protein
MAEISTFTDERGHTYNLKDGILRQSVAPNENGDTSQGSYEEGEIFLWKGRTCIALQGIDEGDVLEDGENLEIKCLSNLIDDKIYDAVYAALNQSY